MSIKSAKGLRNCDANGILDIWNQSFALPSGATFYDSTKFYSFDNFYGFLEEILLELIDNIFKYTLSANSFDPHFNNLVLLGGKSTNNYIKRSKLQKSFDFDLHIMGDNSTPGAKTHDERGIFIADKLEDLITTSSIFKVFRNYLGLILLENDLITPDQLSHYLHERIFYFGTRDKGSFKITGFFIHLVFRKDLFTNGKFYSNGKTILPSKNEIYYPISDFETENIVNFDIPIPEVYSSAYTYKNSYENIDYANYFLTLHNLLRYLYKDSPPFSGPSFGFKFNKNFRKLKNFIDISNYDCKFLNEFNKNQLIYSIFELDVDNRIASRLLKNSVKTLTLNSKTYNSSYSLTFDEYDSRGNFVKNYDILDGYDIFKNLKNFDNYIKKNLASQIGVCSSNILIDYTKSGSKIYTEIFNTPSKPRYSTYLGSFEKVIRDIETLTPPHSYGVIYEFTGAFYTPMNNYLIKNHFGDKSGDVRETIGSHTKKVSEWDKIMDGIFRYYHSNNDIINLKDTLEDEFYLYRFQNFASFSGGKGTLFNISQLKPNDIIFLPIYQSTSFTRQFKCDSFLRPNTFLLKIKVKKELKNWIILNNYSRFSTETEVLIDKNQYYKVTNITHSIVNCSNSCAVDDSLCMREVLTLELEVHSTLSSALPTSPFSSVKIINLATTSKIDIDSFSDSHTELCITPNPSTTNEYRAVNILKKEFSRTPIIIKPLGVSASGIAIGFASENYYFKFGTKEYALKYSPIYGYDKDRTGYNLDYYMYNLNLDTQIKDNSWFLNATNMKNYEKKEFVNFANRDINELVAMKLSTFLVNNAVTPTLPELYRYYLCKDSCVKRDGSIFTKDLPIKFKKWNRNYLYDYTSEHCLILMSPKYTGSLKSIITTLNTTQKEIYAFQILVGLYSMDYYFNIIHSDLNDENILIQNYPKPITNKSPNLYYNLYNVYFDDDKCCESYLIPDMESTAIVWDWGRCSIYTNDSDYHKINKNRRGSINFGGYKNIYETLLRLKGWDAKWDYNYVIGIVNGKNVPDKNIPTDVNAYKNDFKEYFKLFDKFNIKNFKGSFTRKDGTSIIKNTYRFITKKEIYDKREGYPENFLNIPRPSVDLLPPCDEPQRGGSGDSNLQTEFGTIELSNDYLYPIIDFKKIDSSSEFCNDLSNTFGGIKYIIDNKFSNIENYDTFVSKLKKKLSFLIKGNEKYIENFDTMRKIYEELVPILESSNIESLEILLNSYSFEDILLALKYLNLDNQKEFIRLFNLVDIKKSSPKINLLTHEANPVNTLVFGGKYYDKYIKYKLKYLKLKNK